MTEEQGKKKEAVVIDLFAGQGTPALDRAREYKDLGLLYTSGFVHALDAGEELVLLSHEAPAGAETLEYEELHRFLQDAGFEMYALKNSTPVPLAAV